MNEKCCKDDPDVGHEDEGYSCTTHNVAWDECPFVQTPVGLLAEGGAA